ncbi:MauE/DoxX family redox-associated membrane protein [Leeuwenhoekiella sp. NPDC079379]|uniref:DoxX family protein n=1 Tax=Leeuwenhoekiella sp. NPDC079379 TaxID=3364122 RepID=UPI0037CB124D
MNYPWHLFLMAAMYGFAGLMHFIKPKAYLRIMPRYLPQPKALVYLSGLAEIVVGIGLCFPETKNIAIWGIILMLALFLMVHFYMLSSAKAGLNLPKWVLWGRIILQFGLMYWAYIYLSI